VYLFLNAGLAVTLLVLVLAIKSPLPALALVLLSKWRVLAVRPRFWFKNIRSNLVDIIVGLSIVVMLYAASDALMLQLLLTAFYVVWLLVIKPRSKRHYVALQSGVATFLGVSALYSVSYDWPASVVVLLMWLIGYSTSRHVLRHYHEPERNFFAIVWGVVVAEIGWLGYHWSLAYSLPGSGSLQLSQIAFVVVALGFLAERVYSSYHHNEGTIRSNDIVLPAIFSVSIIIGILVIIPWIIELITGARTI
jgi:hypothetical protein